MNVLKFKFDYSKLKQQVFTSIRNRHHVWYNERVLVKTPTQQFEATCVSTTFKPLRDIPTELLLYDVHPHAKTREEAIAFLGRFYPDEVFTGDTVLEIHVLLRVEGGEFT